VRELLEALSLLIIILCTALSRTRYRLFPEGWTVRSNCCCTTAYNLFHSLWHGRRLRGDWVGPKFEVGERQCILPSYFE